MRTFSVGVVGAGVVAQNIHLPVLSTLPNVQVEFVADANDGAARRTAKAFRLPYVSLPPDPAELPSCDVVLLAIPVHVREPYYAALANRGTAVLAEKPFAITHADHMRFEKPFPPSRIGCGYQRRMYATTMFLRRVVSEGWFGPLRRLHISEGGRVTRTGFDENYKDLDHRQGGGALLNIGCHSLDQALFMTCPSDFSIQDCNIAWDGATDRMVTASVRLDGLHGKEPASCELDVKISWLEPVVNEIRLEFNDVTLRAAMAPDGELKLFGPAGSKGATVLTQLGGGAETITQAFILEWNAFLRGMDEDSPSPISASHCRMTTKLIEELLRKGGGK